MDAPPAPESYETLYEEYEGGSASSADTPEFGSDARFEEPFQFEASSKRDEFEAFPVTGSSFADVEDRGFGGSPDYENPKRGVIAKLVSGLVSLFFTVAIIGALGAGAWYFRPQVIALLPQAAALYALLPIEESTSDYDLRNTGYIEAVEDGKRVLIVSGEVVNLTDRPIVVPVIQVTVRTIDGQDLAQWRFKPRGDNVRPGEARYFETRRLDPPHGAQRLHLIVLEED